MVMATTITMADTTMADPITPMVTAVSAEMVMLMLWRSVFSED